MINKVLYIILAFLPFYFASCNDNNDKEFNKGSDELILSASASEATLDNAYPTSIALTLSWGAGSNHGTNASITYSLEMALQGDNFQNPLSAEFSHGNRIVAYTADSLNHILLNDFGGIPDQEMNVEFRVIATVHSENIDTQISNILSVKMTPYLPIATNLYLIGTAANGWSLSTLIGMNKMVGVAGGFTWTGELKAGELKFLTTSTDFVPSYGKGADDNQLYYRETFSDPNDLKFSIPADGKYQITLNLMTLDIDINFIGAPAYADLWFVGDASSWNFIPMTVDLVDPFLFHYNADLTAGEFKVGTQTSFASSVPYIRPSVAGQGPGTDLSYVVQSLAQNPADNKWSITTPGPYKISVNQRTNEIDIVQFTPYSMIYMIGNATDAEWVIKNSIPLTVVDTYKFTWTGDLKVGQLKFTCDKMSDWMGAWFVAATADQVPISTEMPMIFSSSGSNPDNKWKIEEAGNYTIDLDQFNQTVKITMN